MRLRHPSDCAKGIFGSEHVSSLDVRLPGVEGANYIAGFDLGNYVLRTHC